MAIKTCQYASCLEEIGDNGVLVTLRRKTSDEKTHAKFCCAAHAAAAILRLAMDRNEKPAELPRQWRVS